MKVVAKKEIIGYTSRNFNRHKAALDQPQQQYHAGLFPRPRNVWGAFVSRETWVLLED
jgi:hypothetical protein